MDEGRMIRTIEIENFKSIQKLWLDLGRVNVLIGENGCGKTNILEAIALGPAAARNKLDNEYLVPRGIRVTEPRFMRSAARSASSSGAGTSFAASPSRPSTWTAWPPITWACSPR